MARPNKQGLDYFPLDVGIFENEKILAISGEFSVKGEIITLRLLCEIYQNGYFVEFSELLKNKLARLGGLSGGLVEEVVKKLVKYGFFDGSLFSEYNVLTSINIQKTYLEAVKRRKEINISQFWLLNGVNVNINNTSSGVNVNINNTSSGVNVNINPQSKVNKSKVNVLLEKEPKVYICDSVDFSEEESLETDLKTEKRLSKKVAPKKVFNFSQAMTDAGFDPELSAEWLKIRKAKKAVNSELAFKNFMREVEKSGRSPNEVLALVVQKQWKGFEASWLHNEQVTNYKNQVTSSNEQRAINNNTEPKFGRMSASEVAKSLAGWAD